MNYGYLKMVRFKIHFDKIDIQIVKKNIDNAYNIEP